MSADMYDFLRVFIDFFFYPLQEMSLDNLIYVVIHVVIICLVVWSFLRRIKECFGSI